MLESAGHHSIARRASGSIRALQRRRDHDRRRVDRNHRLRAPRHPFHAATKTSQARPRRSPRAVCVLEQENTVDAQSGQWNGFGGCGFCDTLSLTRIGAATSAPIRVWFLLDIYTTMVHKLDERFSISETARLLEVHRGTLRRWIRNRLIPQPIAENTAGARLRYWNKDGFVKVKEYREKHFGQGKGKRNDLKKKRGRKTK
jgi:hypothetical protein